MESKDLTVARLVLGYLKSEKCRSAYKEFFRSSRHLHDLNNLSKKYVCTRFVGLTLEDIITEYSEICQIIRGRLEATNYYSECQFKSSSLIEQLEYLLNQIPPSRVTSPQSTLCPRSPCELNETSPSYIDPNSDVEATPIHDLPGNTPGKETNSHKTPRHSKENSDSFNTEVSSEKNRSAEAMANSEAVALTLMDNKDFHEKMAQTINKVTEKHGREGEETMRTIVGDPIFDKILDEIIGSANIMDGNDESNNNSGNQLTDNAGGRSKTPFKETDQKENHSTRSTFDNTIVNQQNEEAVRNIMATNAKISAETQTQNEEVIVFNGSLDKYLVSNSCTVNSQIVQTAQKPMYINTVPNLVMVPSTLPTTTIPNQQYYVLNKRPKVKYYAVPSNPVSTIITEQDILAMPTVIVNEDRTPVLTTPVTKSKQPRVIEPRRNQVPSNMDIRQYVSSYSAESPKPGLKNVIYPKNKDGSKATIDPRPGISEVIDITEESTEFSSCSITNPAQTNKSDGKNKENIEIATKKVVEVKTQAKTSKSEHKTPQLKVSLTKSTPKSGSHVRNLDFSTPPKITSTHKKTLKGKQAEQRKSPRKKQAVKSLFQHKAKPSTSRAKERASRAKEPASRGKKNTSQAKKGATQAKEVTSQAKEVATQAKEVASQAREAASQAKETASQAKKRTSTAKEGTPTPKEDTSRVKENTSKVKEDPSRVEEDKSRAKEDTSGDIKDASDNSTGNGSSKPWDADLRTLIPVDCVKKETYKRKKPMSGGKARKKPKIETEENTVLNTTEQDAALLEAALKTPIKKVDEDSSNDEEETNEKQELCATSDKLDSTTEINNGMVANNNGTEDDIEIKQDIKNKTILSPSKMNANKRTLVNNSLTEEEQSKFITPEMNNERHICQPMKVNRNLTPLLETPLKEVPKTPGIILGTPVDMNVSTSSNATPFTKMLQANLNLKGIDIASIPTPTIPITPNFAAFTPIVDLISPSPYSNRPTDYSNSSSYYQPSDSEQNKSIEAHILEMEKSSKVVEVSSVQIEQQTSITVSERLSSFNKSIIGKKNLNLIKKDTDSVSSDSLNSESSADEADHSNDSFNCKESNDTVIFKKKTETPRRYPLRPRSVVSYKDPGLSQAEDMESETHDSSFSQEINSNCSNDSVSLDQKQETKDAKEAQADKPQKSTVRKSVDKQEVKKPGRKSTEKQESKKADGKSTEKQKIKRTGRKSTDKQEPKKLDTKATEKRETKKGDKGTKKTKYNCKTIKPKEETLLTVKKNKDSTEQSTEILDVEMKEEKCVDTELGAASEKGTSEENIETTSESIKPVKEKTKPNKNSIKAKPKTPKKEKLCRTKILAELEQKRKRTLTKIKAATEAAQTSRRNGKFKIKPLADVSARKRGRKASSPKKKSRITEEALNMLRQDLNASEDDSDMEESVKFDLEKMDKSASDVEAQNLIDGLKERGIHLMHNKSPKTKYITHGKNTESNQEIAQTTSTSEDGANEKSLNTSHSNAQNLSAKVNSSIELDYCAKDVFDTNTFEGEQLHYIFDENCVPRKIESYDMTSLLKQRTARLYIEEIDREIDIPIRTTEFACLFDSETISETKQSKEAAKEDLSKKDQMDQKTSGNEHEEHKDIINNSKDIIEKSITEEENSTKKTVVSCSISTNVSEECQIDDDLMMFALTGTTKEESLQNVKKKLKTEEFPKKKEKKCENLLKSLNVDSFLNNIHGRHNT